MCSAINAPANYGESFESGGTIIHRFSLLRWQIMPTWDCTGHLGAIASLVYEGFYGLSLSSRGKGSTFGYFTSNRERMEQFAIFVGHPCFSRLY